jgi:mannose-1-phosphate guanylyltransferase
MSSGQVWALVLAAGEGSRLSSLTTTPGGLTVPKQFCSLQGGVSLLEETLNRASVVVPRRRILSVVADRHRRWWEAPLWSLPTSNVIVQPQNKGTAVGLLLPLLHLARRDPSATVLVLPSDHFVRDEALLARSLQRVAQLAHADPRQVYLLGLAPERADAELGYIVPQQSARPGVALVRRFVEKPLENVARGLIDRGALWNVFIMAASARALVNLYCRRYAQLVARLTEVVELDRLNTLDATAARQWYPAAPVLDFSRDVLEGQEDALRVLTVPACGWSDLGTPQRVAETLGRLRGTRDAMPVMPRAAHLNLADQHSRLLVSNG